MKKNSKVLQRIVVDVVLLLALFMLPLWLFVILALYTLFKYDNYYEFIFFGVLADSAYSLSGLFPLSGIIFSISSILIFVVLVWLKSRIISYR